jgi:hypothetical protein
LAKAEKTVPWRERYGATRGREETLLNRSVS